MKIRMTLLACMCCAAALGQTTPGLRFEDKIRIREALQISKQYGDNLFQGYHAAPFAILLVTDSTEFLINHPYPSPDFTNSGYDSFLQAPVYYRSRKFNPRFLATFPAVNGLSCIVVGTPENTEKTSSDWVITLLHERLHQYQNAAPDYFASVNDLGLSGGDQSGMWMLNYPFPYDSLPVIQQYESYTKALHQLITNLYTKKYKSSLKKYLGERKKWKALLSEADYRYFSFQIWQEGIARHTEYKFLDLLAAYSPSKEMRALPDFISFNELKSKMYRAEMENLVRNRLSETKRVCFYSVGFAEGLLLDKLNRSWPEKYLTEKFYIEKYFQ